MDDKKILVDPPLYLVSTVDSCWKCRSSMPVICLIASNAQDSAFLLSNIISLPPHVQSFIQIRFPTFKLTYSKMAQNEYYANTCPKCLVLSGDFHLHSEPDSPFFSISEDDARRLTIEEIPLDRSIEVNAGFSTGGYVQFILQHGKRG